MNLIFPNCSSELGIMSKFGVEIDQSPRCKGVWLDIGELKGGKDTEQIRG